MQQNVSVVERGDHVSSILDRLSEKVGVKLRVADPMGDVAVVCRYSGSLQGFMDAFVQFFAVDKSLRARWVQTRSGFTLERDLVTANAVEALRKDRFGGFVARLEGAIRAPNMTPADWTKLEEQDPELASSLRGALEMAKVNAPLRYFGTLPYSVREQVYNGTPVTVSCAQFGARQFLTDVLGPDGGGYSEDLQVTFYVTGVSPLMRSFCFRLQDQRQEQMGAMALCLEFPDLKIENQQARWVKHFGDPAPKSEATVTLPKQELKDPRRPERFIRRGDYLFRIAEAARVNLIADERCQMLEKPLCPDTGTLDRLFDAACRVQPGMGDPATENNGAFWRKSGDAFLVRSISWPEDEQSLVPRRFVQQWRESEKRNGWLQISDIVGMAGLNSVQLLQLRLWYPQAEKIADVQAPLRWYARCSPAVQQTLRRMPGMPLSILGFKPDDVRVDLDPATLVEPAYVGLMRDIPLERLHLAFLEGDATTREGRTYPALGVVFQEILGGQRRKFRVVSIPLDRELDP